MSFPVTDEFGRGDEAGLADGGIEVTVRPRWVAEEESETVIGWTSLVHVVERAGGVLDLKENGARLRATRRVKREQGLADLFSGELRMGVH